MSSSPETNDYLGEVLQQQERVDMELKRKVRMASSQAAMPAAPAARRRVALAPDEPSGGEGRGVDYRITGFWRWKTVVVPPNAYVVHTRRGVEKPVTIGVGQSFRFNPYTDAFLVVPAAMQTIVINARCICLERQGILVQAYVQWIIDDIATAYRKLDFSDAEDPMRIVNVQLREQAEAAIKDKVATMRIDEVLADKQPIIEELTLRLRAVAEGSREAGSGLGLKIVTVQIKEAVVSSTRLWQNLQAPFRAERAQLARMAEIETDRQVAERELEIRKAREMAEIATQRELQRERALQEQEAAERAHEAAVRRATLEQEAARNADEQRRATEQARRKGELELVLEEQRMAAQRVEAELATLAQRRKLEEAGAARERSVLEQRLALAELESAAGAAVAERDLAVYERRRDIDNALSENQVRSQLVASLPEIASRLPAPKELRSVSISGDGAGSSAALTGLLASLMSLVESAGRPGESKGR